jgi:RecA/RadA recombinase
MNYNMILTDEMKRAIELIENTGEILYITGKAGSGKTTFLKHIVQNIQKKFVVTASTGVAAVNAGGVTLHSLLGVPLGVNNPNEEIKADFHEARHALLNAIDILIIDEISMVRPDTIDYIDQKLRICRESDLPFGGVQLVMFGDLYQLPPVVTDNEKDVLLQFYDGIYFFYAHVLKNCGFQVIEFNQIFRQSDPRFIEILNNIRSYRVTDEDIEDLEALRDKKNIDDFNSQYIHVCSYRKDVQRINGDLLGEPTHTFYAEIKDDFNIKAAPCDNKLKLRVGARVMIIVNDCNHLYYNGSLGVVEKIGNESITVKLDSGYSVTVKRYEWTAYDYRIQDGKIQSVVKGTCRQFPVILAWAITVHKSQGLTFSNVAIHAKSFFCSGQLYVALSRCTSLEGIVSDVFINKKHILPDYELLSFESAYKANDFIFNRDAYRIMTDEKN